MKKLLLIGTAVLLTATSALAQSTSIAHDSRTGYSGSAVTRGNVTTSYDRNGRPKTTVVKHGNTLSVNDHGRRFKLNMVQQGNTTTFYRNGRVIGSTVYRSDGSSTFYHPDGTPGVTNRRVGQ
jgi:hypothetical protein